MMQGGLTRNQLDEKDRIVSYVKQLSFEEIMAPLDTDKLAAELNIQNPLVVAMLEHWIKVRGQRLLTARLQPRR